MKVEFNENGFSAEMDYEQPEQNASLDIDAVAEKLIIKNNGALIFGIVALAIAIGNLPFGLFMNLSTKILAQHLGNGLPHWVSVLFALSAVTLALSLTSGVLSVVCFAKSKKRMTDTTGLVLAIISFAMVCFCFVMNVLGIVAW